MNRDGKKKLSPMNAAQHRLNLFQQIPKHKKGKQKKRQSKSDDYDWKGLRIVSNRMPSSPADFARSLTSLVRSANEVNARWIILRIPQGCFFCMAAPAGDKGVREFSVVGASKHVPVLARKMSLRDELSLRKGWREIGEGSYRR